LLAGRRATLTSTYGRKYHRPHQVSRNSDVINFETAFAADNIIFLFFDTLPNNVTDFLYNVGTKCSTPQA
jgi:hypothetical protein